MKGITLIALPVNTGLCIFQIPKGTTLEEMDAIYTRIRNDFKQILEEQPGAGVINYDEDDCRGMLDIAEPIKLLKSICQVIGEPIYTPDWSNKFWSMYASGDGNIAKLLVLLRKSTNPETNAYLARHGISWLQNIANAIVVKM